jgi:tRNA 2-thiouridine synthesizing protein A
MDEEIVVDCEGMLCPLPVLRARKRLLSLPAGTVICVRATDAMAAIDLPHFCTQAGHQFLGAEQDGAVSLYRIRAGAAPTQTLPPAE